MQNNSNNQSTTPPKSTTPFPASDSDPATPKSYSACNHGEINSKEEMDTALEQFPGQRLKKGFRKNYQAANDYFEKIPVDRGEKPAFIKRLEKLEIRRLYKKTHVRPPHVTIESMSDIDNLCVKHSDVKSLPKYSDHYHCCEVYFKVRNNRDETEAELADRYDVSTSAIGNYRRREEPLLAALLRKREEDEIITKWAKEVDIRDCRKPLEVDRERKTEVYFREFGHKDSVSCIKSPFLEEIPTKTETSEKPSSLIVAIHRGISIDSAKIMYIKFGLKKELAKTIKELREHIKDGLKEKIGPSMDLRIEIVDDRLYIWKRDLNPIDMVNYWHNQYFYLNRKDMFRTCEAAWDKLGLDGSDYEKFEKLSKLICQMTSECNLDTLRKSGREIRIVGEALHLLRDILGMRTKDFEGLIKKVAGANGVRGIGNPKVLVGEEFEVERARLYAILKSDGWVLPSRTVGYAEKNPDRFDIVEKGMQAWGDVELTRYYTEESRGSMETRFPSPFYEALLCWGFPEGDKMMHDEGLGLDIEKLPIEAVIVYFKELFPEDGHFDREFRWFRSVVLEAGSKSEDYDFKSKLTTGLIEFIKDQGTYKKAKQRIVLRMGELQKLALDSNPEISTKAKKLERIILENPSKLMNDEANMMKKKLGINITFSQERIRYSLRTGRVSVSWIAKTATAKDTEKLAILCPPNDVRKKRAVRSWLLKRESKLNETIRKLRMRGIPFDEWWK